LGTLAKGNLYGDNNSSESKYSVNASEKKSG
jgi:hypothetical protein